MYLNRRRLNRRQMLRRESGAVAVIVAILAMVLFAVAAIAVDMGNAMVRKRGVQGQADFAALAGGGELGAEDSGPVPAAVTDAVRDYLNNNQPWSDTGEACLATSTCVTSAQLTDLDESDGEVRFTSDGLQVLTPPAAVNFGFAAALGFRSTQVRADATVGLFSPGIGVMPVYAISGCDYGNQTITDPASGHVVDPPVPVLANDGDSNLTELQSLSTNEVAFQATGVSITLNAKDYKNTTHVGFFRGDDPDPSLVVSPVTFTPSPGVAGHTENGSGKQITFIVPDAVTAVETAWYIRVYNAGTQNKWSARDQAQPLRVGQAVLECTSGSVDGNFGTLRLPRTDVPNADDLPTNIADGLQAPMTLHIHADADSTGLCAEGINGAITSGDPNPGLREKTNCVGTDPGLPANVATEGLIEGMGSDPGRLDKDTAPGCDPTGGDSERTVTVSPHSYTINNDVLSCFLTDGTTSLADITSPTYSGGPKLSPEIYNSPRFFFQPVLAVQPDSGASNMYSIIDFRPAFITDEVVASSTIRGSHTATTENGLTVMSNQVKQMKVVFFNADALSRDDNGQVVTPYLGVGPKILRLID